MYPFPNEKGKGVRESRSQDAFALVMGTLYHGAGSSVNRGGYKILEYLHKKLLQNYTIHPTSYIVRLHNPTGGLRQLHAAVHGPALEKPVGLLLAHAVYIHEELFGLPD